MKNYIKMNNKTTVSAKYRVLVAPGVYQSTASGNYFVRKTVDGTRTYTKFTNKAKAIKFHKSI